MTAFIIFCILAFIILLLLSIPVNFYVKYNGNKTEIWVRYLFIKIQIMPKANKNKKEAKKKTTKKDNKSNKKKKKTDEKKTGEKKKKSEESSLFDRIREAHGISGIIEVIFDIRDLVKKFLGDFTEHILIKKLNISVAVVGDDAADAALKFGYVCSGVYPAVSALSTICKLCKAPQIDIKPDYDNKKNDILLYLNLAYRPLFAVGILLRYVIRVIKFYIKLNGMGNTNLKNKSENKKSTEK